MFDFRLNHILQLQYDGAFAQIKKGFVSKDVYVLADNCLIALGRPNSVQVCISNWEVSVLETYEEWGIEDVEAITEIKENSLVNELLRYVLMSVKFYLKIEPYATEYMLSTLKTKLNEKLKHFNIRIEDNANTLVLTHESKIVTLEVVIEYLYNNVNKDNFSKVFTSSAYIANKGDRLKTEGDLAYAKRLAALNRYEDALPIFLDELKKAEKDSMYYTELAMYIGEAFYHTDNLKSSGAYYKKCNLDYIKDHNDYYLRLGHSILDDKMKDYGELSKIYYRGCLNANYKKSHKEQFDAAYIKLKDQYKEYENMCVKIGKKNS